MPNLSELRDELIKIANDRGFMLSGYKPLTNNELADLLDIVRQPIGIEESTGPLAGGIQARLGVAVAAHINQILSALRANNSEYLVTLAQATNDACKAAYDAKIQDAVNWGDLKCTSAESYISHTGDTGYKVFISEVCYAAPVFTAFIHTWLKEHGFDNVEIITEW